METKNIYQRINAVIAEGLYLKRGSAGQGTGVLYDELISVLQPLLTKHGIVVTTEKTGEARTRSTAKGHYVYECDFNVTYINIDNPEDKFVNLVEAHATDAGDKAPGKAITYAAKINMLKVFQVETGLNDESREEVKEKTKVINPDQFTELAKYCFAKDGNGQPQWTELGKKMLAAYRITGLDQLLAKDYEQALERCKKAASNGGG